MGGALPTATVSFPVTCGPAPGQVSRTCWIVNDTVDGNLFEESVRGGFKCLNHVDNRILYHQSHSRKLLLDRLRQERPSLILGVVKAPATYQGTAMERHYAQGLGLLLRLAARQGGKILFIGPAGNRYTDLAGLQDVLADRIIRQSHCSWCCYGVKDGFSLSTRRSAILSNFATVPACKCSHDPLPGDASYANQQVTYGKIAENLLRQFAEAAVTQVGLNSVVPDVPTPGLQDKQQFDHQGTSTATGRGNLPEAHEKSSVDVTCGVRIF